MSASTDITYTAHPDATPEAELSALVAVYRIVLGAQKEAAPDSRPVDGTKVKEDSANASSLPH
jgi:hypothetical protein